MACLETVTGQCRDSQGNRRADEPRHDRRGGRYRTRASEGSHQTHRAAGLPSKIITGPVVLTSHALEARCLLAVEKTRSAQTAPFPTKLGEAAKTHLLKLSCPAAELNAASAAALADSGDVDVWFGDVDSPGGVESISMVARTPAQALRVWSRVERGGGGGGSRVVENGRMYVSRSLEPTLVESRPIEPMLPLRSCSVPPPNPPERVFLAGAGSGPDGGFEKPTSNCRSGYLSLSEIRGAG